MLNYRSYKFVACIVMFNVMAICQAQGLDTRWLLQVENLKHEVKVEATIRFAGEAATESCMAGTWKRMIVEAKSVQDETFFPLTEPLAYKFEGATVTVGRTKICDRYLFLSGKSKESSIDGTYDAVSIDGSRKLGYFTLKRIK